MPSPMDPIYPSDSLTFAMLSNSVRFKTIVPTYMELRHFAIGKINVRRKMASPMGPIDPSDYLTFPIASKI